MRRELFLLFLLHGQAKWQALFSDRLGDSFHRERTDAMEKDDRTSETGDDQRRTRPGRVVGSHLSACVPRAEETEKHCVLSFWARGPRTAKKPVRIRRSALCPPEFGSLAPPVRPQPSPPPPRAVTCSADPVLIPRHSIESRLDFYFRMSNQRPVSAAVCLIVPGISFVWYRFIVGCSRCTESRMP
jgi:hypothetical protein